MISAYANELNLAASRSFSAIARSVMISAGYNDDSVGICLIGFSAIARSVMISASVAGLDLFSADVFQCYSS